MTTIRPAVTGGALRCGVVDALWPAQPGRSPGRAIHRDQHGYEDVTLEDLRLLSPRNPADPIPAFLARPRQIQGPLPGIVCLHGSGRDRDLLMEEHCFAESGNTLLHGWARELARRGFAALAITQRTYGGRQGPIIQEWAKTELLHGRTAMGGLVEDALCAVDFLANECPEVDAGAIGMTGFSLGGIVTFYSAIVDERIAAAVPVCGGVGSLAVLADHGNTAYHSTYFYVPRLLQVGDHPDLVAAAVPRALLVVAADQDVGMPLDGVSTLAQRGQSVYAAAAHPERFAVRVEHGGHSFTPAALEATAQWFKRFLTPEA